MRHTVSGLPNQRNRKAAASIRDETSEFVAPMEAAIAAQPGVQSVAVSEHAPWGGITTEAVQLSGSGNIQRTVSNISVQVAGPGYFRTLGVPVIKGRPFLATDNATSAPVAIVNESFANRYLAGSNPLSDLVEVGTSSPSHDDAAKGGADEKSSAGGRNNRSPARPAVPLPEGATVVGVVGDVRDFGLDSPPRPEIYLAAGQARFGSKCALLVRTSLPPATVQPEIRDAIKEAGKGTAADVQLVQSMESIMRNTTATRRFTLWALASFCLIALLVSAMGFYSVMGYLTNRSLHAYAVRMALGSTPGGIFAHVMKRAAAIAGVGLALGLLGSYGIDQVLRSLLYDAAPTDPALIAAALGVLVIATFLAAYPPARAAAKIDPARLLRDE